MANLFYVDKFVDSSLGKNWIVYFIIVIVLFVGDYSLSQNVWKVDNTHFPQDRYKHVSTKVLSELVLLKTTAYSVARAGDDDSTETELIILLLLESSLHTDKVFLFMEEY